MEDSSPLATLVQGLPPELFTEILNFTFATTATDQKVLIDKYYHPGSLLQVSKETRQIFTHIYYANTTSHSNFQDNVVPWLLSLPREHIALLRLVTLLLDWPRTSKDGACADHCSSRLCWALKKLSNGGLECRNANWFSVKAEGIARARWVVKDDSGEVAMLISHREDGEGMHDSASE